MRLFLPAPVLITLQLHLKGAQRFFGHDTPYYTPLPPPTLVLGDGTIAKGKKTSQSLQSAW